VRRAGSLIAATSLCAFLLAACGGSSSSAGLIPSTDAVSLGNDLSALESALSEHSCDDTQTALNDIFTDISTLPTSVNTKLRDNLLGGYEELDNTARTQCQATTHKHTGTTSATGTSHTTGVSTGSSGTTSTGLSGTTTTTGPSGTPTGPSGTSTGSSGTVGPGGGSQAPTGSSGTTSADVGSGGVASAP
jgi:hypothetical protein